MKNAVAAAAAEHVDALAPKRPGARSGQEKADAAFLDHEVDFVHERRALLNLVDADHRVAKIAGFDLPTNARRIGQDRGEQSLIEQGEGHGDGVGELPLDVGGLAMSTSDNAPADRRWRAMRAYGASLAKPS